MRHRRRGGAAAAAALLLAACATLAAAQQPVSNLLPRVPPSTTASAAFGAAAAAAAAAEAGLPAGSVAPRTLVGAAAARALDALPAVAARASAQTGWSAERVRAALKEDPSLRLEASGALVYSCALSAGADGADEHDHDHGTPVKKPRNNGGSSGGVASSGPAVEGGAAAGVAAAAEAAMALVAAGAAVVAESMPAGGAADPPYADVFKLHSRPASAKKIYLDFTGHTTTGTYWNTQYNNGADIITPAFDMDGSALTFTVQEATRMVEIWRGVAEDYLGFDVDVTTEEPSSFAGVGVRVVIGGQYSDWYQPNSTVRIAGVAYPGTFGKTSLGSAAGTPNEVPPVFIFAATLFNAAKQVWESITHECGHTFGLQHHGGPSNGVILEYYPGHNGWAPHMGQASGADLSQWAHGEYANATRPGQDDIAFIHNFLSAPPDEAGDTAAAAAPLAITSTTTTAVADGVIAAGGDVDYYSFPAAAGNTVKVVLDLTTPVILVDGSKKPRSDLDSTVSLWGPGGQLLKLWDNQDGLLQGALDTFTLTTTGTHYISIKGAGQGADPTVGYSAYGSMGAYRLTVTAGLINASPDFLACYSDPSGPTRLLKHFLGNTSDMTNAKCRAAAQAAGFLFFATSNGRECWADNTLNGTQATGCMLPCGGGATDPCGGPGQASVFGSNAPYNLPAEYLGCYYDLTLDVELYEDTYSPASTANYKMSIDLCRNLAAAKGYRFYGGEWTRQCWARTVPVPFSGALSETPGAGPWTPDSYYCDQGCGGNTTQKCGSDYYISMYKMSIGPDKEFQGCYQSPALPTRLDNPSVTDTDMTPQKCRQLAAAANLAFYGTSGEACWGGGALPTTAAGACSTPCPGSSWDMCGGPSALSVYQRTIITQTSQLTCKAVAAIQLPQNPAAPDCAGATLAPSSLYTYSGSGTVSSSPALPAKFPVGVQSYLLSAPGLPSCTVSFEVKACAPTGCVAGQGSTSGTTCQTCAVGSYSAGGTFNPCQPCPTGSTTAATGATSAANCTVCLAGYGRSGTGCVQCPAGQFSAGGAASCTVCAAGQFSAAGSASCSACGPSLMSLPGSASCSLCAGGYGSTDNANCLICGTGKFSAGGNSTVNKPPCQACPVGSTTPSTGATSAVSCSVCLAGYGLSGTSCVRCPAGQFSAGGAAACAPCAAGQFSAAGASACSACGAPLTSPAGSASCNLCRAGYGSTDNVNCAACATGSFSPGGNTAANKPPCQACPVGSNTSTSGSTSLGDCIVCLAGYGRSGSGCVLCPPGQFSAGGSGAVCSSCGPGQTSTAGASVCLSCGPGLTAAAGTSSCVLCAAGYGSTDNTTCVACPVGTYSLGGSPTANKPPCQPCPTGSTTAGTGAQDKAGCSMCRPGFGGANCTQCVAGTFSLGGNSTMRKPPCSPCAYNLSSLPGSTSCKLCRAGYGTANCTPCPRGTWSRGGNVTVARPNCTACGVGTTTPSTGVGTSAASCSWCTGGRGGSNCTLCAAGKFSPGGSATVPKPNCTACAVNLYSTAGAISCLLCAKGYGNTTCAICPVGTWSAGGTLTLAKPACTACTGGRSTLTAGSVALAACSVCRAGFGVAVANSTTCAACPAGTFSPGGSAATPFPLCSACPAGFTTAATGTASAAGCIVCAPGFGGPVCAACPVGTFSTGGSAAAAKPDCQNCTGAGTTAGTGAKSAGECNVCRPGAGGPGCATCPANTWSAGGANATCTPCAANFTTLGATGSTSAASCSACAPGYGGANCTMCAAGKYSLGGTPTLQRPGCRTCATGTTSLEGATTCIVSGRRRLQSNARGPSAAQRERPQAVALRSES